MTREGKYKQKTAAEVIRGRFVKSIIATRGEASVLGRPGSDLLFQVLRLSTIGAGEFNGRVRDGIGFRLPAKTTKPAKDRGQMPEIRCQISDV
jgi:hypothetical protein